MTNLVKVEQVQSIDELKQVSEMLAASGYFSDAKDAAQCFVKVLAGKEMGIGAFASMSGIYIIKGKPSVGANLMASAIKRHPRYDYRVIEHTAQVCKIQFRERVDVGYEPVGVSEFTAEDAKRTGTQNMQKYPKNMLFARALSNGVRWYCPDVFDAPVYTPEELGAEVDGEGEVIQAPVEVIEEPAKERPAHLQAKADKFITPGQAKRLFTIATKEGWETEALKQMLFEREGVQSSKEILRANYDQIIENLKDHEMRNFWQHTEGVD